MKLTFFDSTNSCSIQIQINHECSKNFPTNSLVGCCSTPNDSECSPSSEKATASTLSVAKCTTKRKLFRGPSVPIYTINPANHLTASTAQRADWLPSQPVHRSSLTALCQISCINYQPTLTFHHCDTWVPCAT
jgi:hypothetical protein